MQHAAFPHRSPAHVYTGCCEDEEQEEERAERCDLSHSMRKENLFLLACELLEKVHRCHLAGAINR